MVTQIKCGIKAKQHEWSVLRNLLTTRFAVGAKIPRPKVEGLNLIIEPHYSILNLEPRGELIAQYGPPMLFRYRTPRYPGSEVDGFGAFAEM